MNYLKTIIAATAMLVMAPGAEAQEVAITQEQIPAAITQFVRKHYPTARIIESSRENNFRKTEYELKLDNGTKLEFANLKLKEIDGTGQVPNSILPAAVLRYVLANYPNSHVVEWKSDDRKQKVELNTGEDLEFSRNGKFLRLDR